MSYSIRPMNIEDIGEVVQWRYEEPYNFYNIYATQENLAEMQNGTYYSAVNEGNQLVGFFCYGESAQVPAGRLLGLYDSQGFMDIGLAMKPELTGKGIGAEFIRAGMSYGQSTLGAKKFRLTVADFNKRAAKVYEKVGFRRTKVFESKSSLGIIKFSVMVL